MKVKWVTAIGQGQGACRLQNIRVSRLETVRVVQIVDRSRSLPVNRAFKG